MKTFRFPLEAVLEARSAQEAEARRELGSALEQQRLADERSAESQCALNLLLQNIAAESAGRFSAATRERSWLLRRTQEQLCEELRAAAGECRLLADAKRRAVIEARRNCELLEQLKLSQQESWNKEAARTEQLQLDEFAMSRRHQTSQKSSAIC